MATVDNFPEEVLLMIFENLQMHELREAQKVCRACTRNIQQFITSIDHNPNSKYLKAVKSISINVKGEEEDDEEEIAVQFDIKKLFFRFSNLQSVFVYNFSILFQDFNDQVSKDFLKHCPNLKKIDIKPPTNDKVETYEFNYKIRLLLTEINVEQLSSLVTTEKSIADYIAEFPRVQSLVNCSDLTDTFQAYLPVFERLNHVTKLDIINRKCDQMDFTERYLGTKTEEQQNLIRERLSKVKELKWAYVGDSPCINSAVFLDKYLTGLDKLAIINYSNQSGEPLRQKTFIDNVLRSLCSTKRNGYLIHSMEPDAFSICFPGIIETLFKQTPLNYSKSTNRVLQLKLSNNNLGSFVSFQIKLQHSSPNRTICISTANDASYQNIQRNVLDKAALMDDIDELVLELSKNHRTEATLRTYHDILSHMVLVKKVTLDISGSNEQVVTRAQYTDIKDTYTNYNPFVKELVLKPIKSNATLQAELAAFSVMFPSLEDLAIERFCGVWEEGMQEYQVKLPYYLLKSLTIDVAGIVKWQLKPFFVVDVEFLCDTLRYSYKVSTDLSSVTRIQHADLKGSMRGEDYYALRIVVQGLRKLVLRLQDEEEEYWKRVNRAIIEIKD